ncbi:MAG: hypothetical protein DRH70_04265 [Candidatus Coatesbacteria bacterium]|nr:MAG: hypothetical protein DRH70_04265 [Candidatus Coatesbacteria bacterium]
MYEAAEYISQEKELTGLQYSDGKRGQGELQARKLAVVVASEDMAQCGKIKNILEDQQFIVMDEALPNRAVPAKSLLVPSAVVVQVEPDPAEVSAEIAQLRSESPEMPILFAVDANTEQLEINVRKMGVQYYMLLPDEMDSLAVIVHCLIRA